MGKLIPEPGIASPCIGCMQPSIRGIEVCKDCARKPKAWQSDEEYRQAMRDEERAIDLANDEYHLKQLEDERLGRPSWQDTYFEIAKVIAKRSKDPHTKVGAVLVKDGHILGVGYNGEPRNFTYGFDWHSKEKYQYVIHAEMNAITNATTIGANVVGADIYLTLSPCTECMKLLIQNRIRTVYFLEKYTDYDKTQMMAEHSDIKLVHVEQKGENNG